MPNPADWIAPPLSAKVNLEWRVWAAKHSLPDGYESTYEYARRRREIETYAAQVLDGFSSHVISERLKGKL